MIELELSDKEKRLIRQWRSYHNGSYATVIDKLVASAQPEPCEDAVGRDAVVRFLDDWISALDANCHHQSMADLKIVKNDFKNLPSAQPMRWIPCSERPPERNGRYLITGKTGSVYSLDYTDGRWYGGISPVAWMSLPKAYKEERK